MVKKRNNQEVEYERWRTEMSGKTWETIEKFDELFLASSHLVDRYKRGKCTKNSIKRIEKLMLKFTKSKTWEEAYPKLFGYEENVKW